MHVILLQLNRLEKDGKLSLQKCHPQGCYEEIIHYRLLQNRCPDKSHCNKVYEIQLTRKVAKNFTVK